METPPFKVPPFYCSTYAEVNNLTPQARPNVIFEAGMAMGRSPDRVILIEFGRLRPFSDVGGRHTVGWDDTPKTRQEIAQRLQIAGCAVDLSGTDWHSAGDFALNARTDRGAEPTDQSCSLEPPKVPVPESQSFAAIGSIADIMPTDWISAIQPESDYVEKDGDLEDPEVPGGLAPIRGMGEFFKKLSQKQSAGTIILRGRDHNQDGDVKESIKASFRYIAGEHSWTVRVVVNEDTPQEAREAVYNRLVEKIAIFTGSKLIRARVHPKAT